MIGEIVSHKVKKWLTHKTVTSAETIVNLSNAPSDASDLSERSLLCLFAIVPGSSDTANITIVGFPESEGEGVYLGEAQLSAKIPISDGYTTDILRVDTLGCKKFVAYVTAASDFGSGIELKYMEV